MGGRSRLLLLLLDSMDSRQDREPLHDAVSRLRLDRSLYVWDERYGVQVLYSASWDVGTRRSGTRAFNWAVKGVTEKKVGQQGTTVVGRAVMEMPEQRCRERSGAGCGKKTACL